jgi:two-component system CheB/CheR fusion protein
MATLLVRTGHDFRTYKRATVLRRLERRLQVTQQSDLPAYLEYLKGNVHETDALLQDMLIAVTSFFRDRDAFEALEREAVAAIVERCSPGAQIRAWSVGCATGEEPYSLAMLLDDHLPATQPPVTIQVFGSDIDARALAVARSGVYPEVIVNDVPPTRVRKYFDKSGGAYRVKRWLRDQVVFAQHNILHDPPFSRVDIIACRNLLIYLEREAQAQVLGILHFALNRGGLLLLGSAETADWVPELFSVVDKKNRIYRANPAPRRRDLLPLRVATAEISGIRRVPALRSHHPPPAAAQHGDLIADYAEASVVTDAQFRILYAGTGAAPYLRHVAGAPSADLLHLLRPELAAAFHPALLLASRTGQRVATKPVRMDGPSGPVAVTMTVRPKAVEGEAAAVMHVLFDEVDAVVGYDYATPPQPHESDNSIFQQEIRRLQDQLDGTADDSAASTEALRAANEELQSINEELRSATEELETSKEELQSLNEELTTVNYELKNKVDETAKINDDLTNLIASMEIATLFVDRALYLRGFTPRASDLFNVLRTDVGRPLFDITHHLQYETLAEDIGEVISSLSPIEREIADDRNRWYLMRISPYRTNEDRIDGAVVNFIDITEQRSARQALRATSERLRLVVESTPDYAIITLDADGLVTSWNKGAELIFGYSAPAMLGQHFRQLFTPADRANGVPEQELRQALEQGRAPDERWHARQDGSLVYCSGTTTSFSESEGVGFAKIARDLTERQLFEKRREDLLLAEKEIRQQLEAANAMRSEFLAVLSHELKNPLNLILMNAELISRTAQVANTAGVNRAVEIIRHTVHAQSQIIDDLLDLSRLTTGKLALRRAAVELRPVIEQIVDAVRRDAQDKGVTVQVEGEDCTLFADMVRVEQIIWNLIRNAIKFTPAGGKVTLRLGIDAGYGTIEVADTGRGIEPQFLNAIFDMFHQVGEKASTRRQGGMGIGLALVKSLAELQGGRVEANSAGIDLGARFTVWLPLFKGTQGNDQADTPLAGLFQDRRVLVVDDDAETLDVLASLLRSEGAVVTPASSARQALTEAAAGEFDLVLSDIAMPGMDGLELMHELRASERYARVPAIAISGFGRPADIERSKAAGFDAHLPKPLSLEALAETWLSLSRAGGAGTPK